MHERSVTITGGLWDAHSKYLKESKYSKVDRSTYVKICHEFNKAISEKIIKESFEYKLPYRLGYLRIKAFLTKPKIEDGKIVKMNKRVDWNATRKLWRDKYPNKTVEETKEIKNKPLVYHLNEHTDGYIMKWYWDKRFSSSKNQSVYLFRPVKGGVTKEGHYNGRVGLGQWIKNPLRKNEYYE